jgi:tRNA(Ile)-lysidine synthase
MLKKNILTFVKQFVDLKCPLLIGVSGGPDSIALLHLLIQVRRLKIAIAHVDHRWRTESASEAEAVRELAKSLDVPFYLKVLDPKLLEGNMENACREERLNFFRELCNEHGFQAVALGHQADDVAETTLKRIFEGAALARMGGLTTKKEIDGLTILRPLLPINKQAILDYNKKHNLRFFEDPTNSDEKYCRGKLRSSVLPLLTEQFGKNVSKGLQRVAAEAEELKGYLDFKTQESFEKRECGSLGVSIDLSDDKLMHDIELKHLLQRIASERGAVFSRECYDSMCNLIRSNAANKKVGTNKCSVAIDKKKVLFN